jgi:hypothetical protein
MAEPKSLKEQNAWLIRAVVIAHLVTFAWIALKPLQLISLSRGELLTRLEASALPGTVSLGMIMIAALILLGALPAKWRDRLIHLRWSNPLPGARAFSVFGPDSSRVDMTMLASKYGTLPSAAAEQDRLFYKIYSEHRDETGVLDAHRSYLAARDIGTINAILAITLPWIALWATGDWQRCAVYMLIMLGAYLLCAVAAKNYGARMVENVLATASRNHALTRV